MDVEIEGSATTTQEVPIDLHVPLGRRTPRKKFVRQDVRNPVIRAQRSEWHVWMAPA